jgi:hypothetical protein
VIVVFSLFLIQIEIFVKILNRTAARPQLINSADSQNKLKANNK